jgi:hypothetical protein
VQSLHAYGLKREIEKINGRSEILLIVCMATLVVLAISNGCELLGTEVTKIRLLSCMSAHMDE